MTVSVAGSFHYYVTSGADPGPLCDGYLSVDPELPRGLPLDSLVCQTVLAKLLGPLASWRDKLEVAYRWVTCHVSHVTSYVTGLATTWSTSPRYRGWGPPTPPTPWRTSWHSMRPSPGPGAERPVTRT